MKRQNTHAEFEQVVYLPSRRGR